MLTQEQKPCWWAVCDFCGEGDNTDYGTSSHFQTEADLRTTLRDDLEWHVMPDGHCLHLHCYEELRGQIPCPHGSTCNGGGCGACPTDEQVFAQLKSGA